MIIIDEREIICNNCIHKPVCNMSEYYKSITKDLYEKFEEWSTAARKDIVLVNPNCLQYIPNAKTEVNLR